MICTLSQRLVQAGFAKDSHHPRKVRESSPNSHHGAWQTFLFPSPISLGRNSAQIADEEALLEFLRVGLPRVQPVKLQKHSRKSWKTLIAMRCKLQRLDDEHLKSENARGPANVSSLHRAQILQPRLLQSKLQARLGRMVTRASFFRVLSTGIQQDGTLC